MQAENRLTANVGEQRRQLAVMLAVSWPGDASVLSDVAAMYDSLRLRSFQPNEILSLMGDLHRGSLIAFLERVSEQISTWSEGEIFFYCSGHGYCTESEEPGLWLSEGQDSPQFRVLWEEMFKALRLPRQVRVTLLPDA